MDVEYLFEETLKKFGRIDVVVNNAGVMSLSPLRRCELFDKVIHTNLRGTFLVSTQAAKRVAEGGTIVAFSSSVLAKSFPAYGSLYCVKSACGRLGSRAS